MSSRSKQPVLLQKQIAALHLRTHANVAKRPVQRQVGQRPRTRIASFASMAATAAAHWRSGSGWMWCVNLYGGLSFLNTWDTTGNTICSGAAIVREPSGWWLFM
jgi:hypothetical protein